MGADSSTLVDKAKQGTISGKEVLQLIHDKIFDGGFALKAAFMQADVNKDGRITQAELKAVLKAKYPEYNVGDKALDELFGIMDDNQNGSIDYDEFLAAVNAQHYSYGQLKKEVSKKRMMNLHVGKSTSTRSLGGRSSSVPSSPRGAQDDEEQEEVPKDKVLSKQRIYKGKALFHLRDELSNEEILLRMRHALTSQVFGLKGGFKMMDIDQTGLLTESAMYEAMRHAGFILSEEVNRRLFVCFEVEPGLMQWQKMVTAIAKCKFAMVREQDADIESEAGGDQAQEEDQKDSGVEEEKKVAEKAPLKLRFNDDDDPNDILVLLHDRLYDGGASLLDSFRKFDANKDGIVSSQEMTKALAEHHNIVLSDGIAKELWWKFDHDNNDSIDFAEFVRIVQSKPYSANMERKKAEELRLKREKENQQRQQEQAAVDREKAEEAAADAAARERAAKKRRSKRTKERAPDTKIQLSEYLTNAEALLRIRNTLLPRKHDFSALKDAFNSVDKQNPKGITRKEFVSALYQIGFIVSEGMAKRLFLAFDKNDDGFIEYKEFLQTLHSATFVGFSENEAVPYDPNQTF